LDAIVNALTELGGGDPLPLLTNILLYHVSPGAQPLEVIQASETLPTLLEGATLTPDGNSLVDAEPDLANPNFVEGATDIRALNGTVQALDRVLIPLDIPGNEPPAPPEPEPELTIAGLVAQSGDGFDSNNQDFDILLSAVQTAGLVEALDDPAADLTVFAPTDEAFITLAQDLGFRGIDEAGAFDAISGALTELGGGDPLPLLTDILLYHVSPGAKSQAQIQADGTVPTLLTDATFTVEGDDLIDNEPDLVNPSFVEGLTDVSAANGTIQGIDRVLIPLDIPSNSSCVITGSSSQDFLFSFLDNTLFVANEGDDFVIGGFGDDQINGNEGDDVLFGSGGSDILQGSEGNDLLLGSFGDDLLLGSAGHDTLLGGSGDDLLDGGTGEDALYLDGGNDTAVLRLGGELDTIFGFHPGEDRFALADGLSFASLSFQAGQGFTTITAGEAAIALVLDTAPDSLSVEANFTII
jgi:uncharacterized surface protein with fasciclin (FAS1) repeats